jgi:2-dehydropantoate 2-reductase
MTIAVLGPGGVGGFLSAALSRSGEDVLVIAREATAQTIAERGIELRSVRIGDFTAHPRAAATLREPVDLLIISTKATTLDEALARVETPPALVIPLLNGLDHIARLRAAFDRVAAASIRIEADRPAPGVIVQSSPFLRVDLAADDPVVGARLPAFVEIFQRAGVPAQIGASEAQVMWSKLVRLNALALTTSAIDRPIGFIRSDPEWRAALIDCLQEASAVANADGAANDWTTALAELEAAHAQLGSSMQRDIAARRPPELDAIAGAVLRAARRHGLQCPTIARLSAIAAERAGVPRPAA